MRFVFAEFCTKCLINLQLFLDALFSGGGAQAKKGAGDANYLDAPAYFVLFSVSQTEI